MAADATEGPNAAQAAFWTEQPGQKWAIHQNRLDTLFTEVTDLLIARSAIEPGESILDIGCGTGALTLEAANKCGPAGRALGVDISETLLAVSRGRAAGRANIRFALADAQTHAFEPAAADIMISRFGTMFFADPVAAFRNIASALRPGGRLVFASWAPAAQNPWSHIAKTAGTERLGSLPAEPPRTPGQFAFAELDYVTDILGKAGLTDIEGAETETRLFVPGTADDAADLATSIGPVAVLMREKNGTEEDRKAITADVANRLAAFVGPDGLRIPATVNVFSARR
ncbi:class I SAM-dependent methyltransferase [Defluviimonas aestuarii]|uniref:class I SAM-dependent methyltransferase n=1 Tax=Albidovulum aestuarii TaxID=1130726 RepID=UPI00249B90B7|nr:class I SAM-dependent methyltransferase [Defluviimonas aestuarii]MDI3336511.1 class I SAM-dependent methyltransferase [Defluviimonas aestuarii]